MGLVDAAGRVDLLRRPRPRRRARRRAPRRRTPRPSTATGSPSTSSRGRTSSSRTCARSAGRASSTARTRASTRDAARAGSTSPTGWRRRAPRRRTSGSSRRSRRPATGTGSPSTARLATPLGAARSSCSTRPSGWSSWSADPEITSDRRARPSRPRSPTEGVGTVEAPRGTLTHHYRTDERGIVTRVNLIVGTTNNYAPIAMSVDRAARGLIHGRRGRRRGPAQPDRDGLPGLRPVLRLRHPLAARPDAARGHDPRRCGERGRCPPPRLLSTPARRRSSSAWATRSSATTGSAGGSPTRSSAGWTGARGDRPATGVPVEVDRLAVGGLPLMERLVGYRPRRARRRGPRRRTRPARSDGPRSRRSSAAWHGHLDSAHDATLVEAISAGRALGAHLPDEVTVVGVAVERTDEFGERLSPGVAAAVAPAVEAILAVLGRPSLQAT